ncbi:MAG: HEPN domain-containing protein [Methanospirillum sp.]|nr:HEPN domain-containing protein [Methanospirillum sp.]
MDARAAYRTARGRPGETRGSTEARQLLARARSSLALARSNGRGILVEDLIALAHQAVERAVRAVAVAAGVPAPPGETAGGLIAALWNAGVPVPDRLNRAASHFSGWDEDEPVRIEQYYESVLVATEAIRFAEQQVCS